VTGNPKFDSLAAAQTITDYGCTSCHNFGGGGGNIGPDLSHGAPKPSLTDIRNQIMNGGNGMPPFGSQLSKAQVDGLVAFVDGLRTGNPPSQ
jgi:mono/diheme cytochrome c family protein